MKTQTREEYYKERNTGLVICFSILFIISLFLIIKISNLQQENSALKENSLIHLRCLRVGNNFTIELPNSTSLHYYWELNSSNGYKNFNLLFNIKKDNFVDVTHFIEKNDCEVL